MQVFSRPLTQGFAFRAIPREVELTLEVVARAIPVTAGHMNTVPPSN